MDLSLIPQEQYDRVFRQNMCDIDYEFLGFTDIYERLAEIIPRHWTIVDLGCAYSPQAFLFRDHKAYVGVDIDLGGGPQERFIAPNTTHYIMPISDFIRDHVHEFDQSTTFAICSYVPPWHGDNMKMARDTFKNVFTYYPAGEHFQKIAFDQQNEASE